MMVRRRIRTEVVCGAGLLLGVVVAAELWMSRLTTARQAAFAATAVLGGWGFLAAGLLARRQRPASRTGMLMLALGFAWLLGALQLSDHDRLAVTVGTLLGWLWAAILAHLMLAFPSGRLADRRARALVVCAYLIATVGECAWSLFADARIFYRSPCDGCALPLVSFGSSHRLAEVFIAVQRLSAAVVAVLACGVLVSYWRNGTLVQRRALAPVLAFGALTGLLLAASITALAGGWRGLGRAAVALRDRAHADPVRVPRRCAGHRAAAHAGRDAPDG